MQATFIWHIVYRLLLVAVPSDTDADTAAATVSITGSDDDDHDATTVSIIPAIMKPSSKPETHS